MKVRVYGKGFWGMQTEYQYTEHMIDTEKDSFSGRFEKEYWDSKQKGRWMRSPLLFFKERRMKGITFYKR